ncbi:hypothetical protein OQA88_10697 [Cercophora sp. LCS_1]
MAAHAAPIDRMPIEISAMILSELDDPKDLMSAITASRSLRYSFMATRKRTLKAVITKTFGDNLRYAIAANKVPSFEEGDMFEALPGVVHEDSPIPAQCKWVKRVEEFVAVECANGADQEWEVTDEAFTMGLYKLYNTTNRLAGPHVILYQGDRYLMRLKMRGLILFEVMARLCMRPYYLAVIDYVRQHDAHFEGAPIDIDYMSRAMETIRTPRRFLRRLTKDHRVEVHKVMEYLNFRYGKYTTDLGHHIVKQITNLGKRNQDRQVKPNFSWRGIVRTSNRLKKGGRASDEANKVYGRQVAVSVDLGQAAALGLGFFHKIKEMDKLERLKTLVDVAATLNLENEPAEPIELEDLRMNRLNGARERTLRSLCIAEGAPLWSRRQFALTKDMMWQITRQDFENVILQNFGVPIFYHQPGKLNAKWVEMAVGVLGLAEE